ncbi:hypothetical protein GWK47_025158 [Chionoecetes opilio]|uniref:Uncharacterized protein n=1 Tax=Chionoecetes opilio TaxID=41210 RepID=A0A8J4XMV5_CHIOP|nr:hypothetical protein GWK47_025158 [Chionoecetes opilio]
MYLAYLSPRKGRIWPGLLILPEVEDRTCCRWVGDQPEKKKKPPDTKPQEEINEGPHTHPFKNSVCRRVPLGPHTPRCPPACRHHHHRQYAPEHDRSARSVHPPALHAALRKKERDVDSNNQSWAYAGGRAPSPPYTPSRGHHARFLQGPFPTKQLRQENQRGPPDLVGAPLAFPPRRGCLLQIKPHGKDGFGRCHIPPKSRSWR